MTHIKLWLTPTDHLIIPGETYEEDSDGGLDMMDADATVIATAAAKTWLVVQIISDDPQAENVPPKTNSHQTYEPCVVDADGRCTRASHDHSADPTEVYPAGGPRL